MATASTPIRVQRLNHVVLQVSDVERSIKFYQDILGLELHRRRPNGNAFLRIPGSSNDHDLALFPRDGISRPKDDSARLIHMAWQVDDPRELLHARDRLEAAGALVGSQNHGMSLSLYAQDPDGIEFEVFWAPPGAAVGENIDLDLEGELAKYGVTTSRA